MAKPKERDRDSNDDERGGGTRCFLLLSVSLHNRRDTQQ